MDLFQSDIYLSFLESVENLTPFKFSIYRDDSEVGRIQGYTQKDGNVIMSFLSRRAIINGGPFLADDITADEVRSLLEKCVTGLKRDVIYIESRNFRDYSSYRSVFEDAGFRYEPHYDFVISTEDQDVVESKIGKSRKRDVKVSLKNGVSVVEEPSIGEISDFYSILEELYRTRVKTPLFPKSFFMKLWEMPFSKFILVKYKDRIVGGTLCVFDNDTVYEWFACGEDGAYKNVFPSTVATYYGIQFAVQNGFQRFDMMGAGSPGDGGYGVREFKAKFGGELVEYGRFRYITNKPLFAIGQIGVKLMKKL
jgi:Uncharacterized protein involved in methicillin resistance